MPSNDHDLWPPLSSTLNMQIVFATKHFPIYCPWMAWEVTDGRIGVSDDINHNAWRKATSILRLIVGQQFLQSDSNGPEQISAVQLHVFNCILVHGTFLRLQAYQRKWACRQTKYHQLHMVGRIGFHNPAATLFSVTMGYYVNGNVRCDWYVYNVETKTKTNFQPLQDVKYEVRCI